MQPEPCLKGWDAIDLGGVHRCYLTEVPPINMPVGTQWLDTRENAVKTWNGADWVIEEEEQ